MDYIFQLDQWTDERRIIATYVESDAPLGANDFEPITFSSEDLDAESYEGFVTSRLDTLVVLYTGRDPAKLLQDVACVHDSQEECDCSPVSIIIPRLLAYHAATLSREIENLSLHFEETTVGDRSMRRYRLPDGQAETAYNREETSFGNWEKFDFLKWQHIGAILNNWYAQGISLHVAWITSKEIVDENMGLGET